MKYLLQNISYSFMIRNDNSFFMSSNTRMLSDSYMSSVRNNGRLLQHQNRVFSDIAENMFLFLSGLESLARTFDEKILG